MKNQIEINTKQELLDVKKSVDEVYYDVADMFSLLVEGNIPIDLTKAINDFETETIKKFSKNLDDHERKAIYDMLTKWKKYHANIIEGTKEILGK